MIHPLNKEIHARALEMGIEKITLAFSGGHDEGYLVVNTFPFDPANEREVFEFREEIENWAFNEYSYSGAGEGIDYGDDITYDLIAKTASHQSWAYEIEYQDAETLPLSIE